MGDRANIVVLGDEDMAGRTAVFLYSHWGGFKLPETLKAGLNRKERWNDAPYLARILFQQMIGTDCGTTGFGISTTLTDNEHPLLVVDVMAQVVTEYPEEEYKQNGFAHLAKYRGVPFCKYSGKWRKKTAGGGAE